MKLKTPTLQVVEPDHEARAMLEEIRAEHHPGLRPDDIEMQWFLSGKMSKGKRVLGTCKVVGEELYRLSGVNILISLDRLWWDSVPKNCADAKRYLVDHELCHAAPQLMEVEVVENGQVVGIEKVHAFDAGKPPRYLYRPVGHDLEDFADPIARWGVQPDLAEFLDRAQLGLPLHMPKGVESVEIRVAGESGEVN